ncbi:hypothetical protein HMPREF3192_00737 [Atopobium deltae]|uniref:Uncharacterized protein n=1 Tax=Atopobium deltae TaxID=1393034 RepID=A0A133XV71_9ACTN|nr:hypothetical protein HMPREF3192_00737 [Atopobium deltae]
MVEKIIGAGEKTNGQANYLLRCSKTLFDGMIFIARSKRYERPLNSNKPS